MKLHLLLIASLLTATTSSCITIYESNTDSYNTSNPHDKKIKLSGITETDSYDFNGIERYSASGLVPVVYHPVPTATKTTVTVTADKALMPYIKVKNDGNELRIYRTNNRSKGKNNVKITVTGPTMTSYKMDTSATLSISGLLSAPDGTVKFDTSSSSGIWADSITAKAVTVSTSSSSDVDIKSVNAGMFKASSSSSSRVYVSVINADSTKATASSSAKVTLKGISAKSVVASASSSAAMVLDGHTVNADIESSSSGSVSWEGLSTQGSIYHTW